MSTKKTVKLDYSKNELDYSIELIENTPFHVIKKDSEYHVVMGKYRISEGFKNREEAVEDAKSITWNRITQVMFCLFDTNANSTITIKNVLNEN